MEPAAATTSRTGNAGFTLTEVMVAILILTVGLLGLLQVFNVAMEQNMRNAYRSEAVRLAEDRVSRWRLLAFDNITANHASLVKTRIRGVAKDYRMMRSQTLMTGGNARELAVRVGWTYKNLSSFHEVRTLRNR